MNQYCACRSVQACVSLPLQLVFSGRIAYCVSTAMCGNVVCSLQPTPLHLTVKDFVTPEKFDEWRAVGESMGFRYVASGPLVRAPATLLSAGPKEPRTLLSASLLFKLPQNMLNSPVMSFGVSEVHACALPSSWLSWVSGALFVPCWGILCGEHAEEAAGGEVVRHKAELLGAGTTHSVLCFES